MWIDVLDKQKLVEIAYQKGKDLPTRKGKISISTIMIILTG